MINPLVEKLVPLFYGQRDAARRFDRAMAQLEDEAFPDGYCVCSCGPVHHEFHWATFSEHIQVSCTYHKRECGRIDR